MSERKPISKRLRFEVLKRDAFTCQYCGKQPPDTVLHIDHIVPVAKGGKNTLINLVTSCCDCNLGKSDKELSDDSAVKKQQKQLSELAEKKAQIEMMIEWRELLLEADELLTKNITALINKYLVDWSLNDTGINHVRKAIKKRGYLAVFDAIEECYCKSKDSEDFRGKYSGAIDFAGVERKPSISYAKGILKNRGIRINDRAFHAEFHSDELTVDQIDALIRAAKRCNTITDFRNAYEVITNG